MIFCPVRLLVHTSCFFSSRSSVEALNSCSVTGSRLHSDRAVMFPLSTLCIFCTNILASNFQRSKPKLLPFQRAPMLSWHLWLTKQLLVKIVWIGLLAPVALASWSRFLLFRPKVSQSPGLPHLDWVFPVGVLHLSPELVVLALSSTSLVASETFWLPSVTVDFSWIGQLDF